MIPQIDSHKEGPQRPRQDCRIAMGVLNGGELGIKYFVEESWQANINRPRLIPGWVLINKT